MQIQTDRFSLLPTVGLPAPKKLVLTAAETKTLRDAQALCKKIARGLGEDDDGIWTDAEWKLDIVVSTL